MKKTSLTTDRDARLYGNRFLAEAPPDKEFPASGMPALDAMRLVDEELVLEGDPWRNLATFVDHAEYPISAEIEQRCIRMLADVYHAPGETTGCDGTEQTRVVEAPGVAHLFYAVG